MEEEICVLDPGSSHRGQGGRQGSLGRADSGESPRRMGEITPSPGGLPEGQLTDGLTSSGPSCFFVDTEARYGEMPLYYCDYERQSESVLGADGEDEDTKIESKSRCFNCGSLEHMLTSCPEPRDRQLIALSRQLFDFYKGDDGLVYRRFHEVEEWKRQRLEWLEEFEPGEIRGEVLRDALGLQGNDSGQYVEWLSKISDWGYPKGWVGSVDPRYEVWKVISEGLNDTSGEVGNLIIFGERYSEESSSNLLLSQPTTGESCSWSSGENDEDADTHSESSSISGKKPVRRWATYPDTYFSSDLLPIYDGNRLPPIDSGVSTPSVSSTFTTDRQALWNRLISQSTSQRSGDTVAIDPGSPVIPPPPSTTPPPLPPSLAPPHPPASEPPYLPPPPGVPEALTNSNTNGFDASDVDSDMELSD